ncbi:hypothetical protein Pcinc_026229 [Petrolisthes cinctipes]|uniref:Uncharacterized protein n=1 Tax=Petrolisthes cinctipes TaxID=88211 RepID=A0AAE1F7M8_PETCI|nr:hypothetical protein Pcinc_026229 [Petrolisthes cinctipes]
MGAMRGSKRVIPKKNKERFEEKRGVPQTLKGKRGHLGVVDMSTIKHRDGGNDTAERREVPPKKEKECHQWLDAVGNGWDMRGMDRTDRRDRRDGLVSDSDGGKTLSG